MKIRMSLFVKRNPFKTACELRNKVFGWSVVSVRRIQEILKNELGLPSRVAAKKPMLTEKMVKKQLAFCKKFKHRREKDWRKVMYSDESTFRLVNSWSQGQEAQHHVAVQAPLHHCDREKFS
jgi:hypothetical protein